MVTKWLPYTHIKQGAVGSAGIWRKIQNFTNYTRSLNFWPPVSSSHFLKISYFLIYFTFTNFSTLSPNWYAHHGKTNPIYKLSKGTSTLNCIITKAEPNDGVYQRTVLSGPPQTQINAKKQQNQRENNSSRKMTDWMHLLAHVATHWVGLLRFLAHSTLNVSK